MAVHPYNSTLTLLAAHRPLLRHLENVLQRPIEFYTAASFEAYVRSLMAGEYDIAISPPHFALLAIDKGLYVPVARYKTELEPVLVVRRESPIQRAADFAGKMIAMADKSALIRILVLKWLSDAGLAPGSGYRILERPSHGASISATIMGEADAGLATATALKQAPPDVRDQVRLIATGLKFPHLFTLANPRLGEPTIARLGKALRMLTDAHPDGKEFFDKTGFGGYEEIGAAELAALRPYLDPTRQLVESMR